MESDASLNYFTNDALPLTMISYKGTFRALAILSSVQSPYSWPSSRSSPLRIRTWHMSDPNADERPKNWIHNVHGNAVEIEL